MLKEKNLDYFGNSFQMYFQNNMISNQDNINLQLNQQVELFKITKKEKDFITRNNKSFYKEFKNILLKNIELKDKLNELIAEKKRLYDIIIKMEHKIKNSNSLDNKEVKSKSQNIKNNITNIIIPYNKRKRIRRKKAEITYIYNCNFPNCDKSYPSKSSLNMHIKLKHQKQK